MAATLSLLAPIRRHLVLLLASLATAGLGLLPPPLAARPPAPGVKEARSGQQDGRVAVDRYGDPLPPGALLRFGTGRLRHPSWVDGIALSPDGKMIASAGWEGAIWLWDAARGVETACWRGHKHVVMGLAFSPDGKVLASAGADGMICVWDTGTGRCRRCWKGHEGSMVLAVAISPDGRLLASGGGGEERPALLLWDLASGKQVGRLGDTVHPIQSLAFSPDGKHLAAASPEWRPPGPVHHTGPGRVQLWDVSTGKLRWQRKEEQCGVTSVAFAPNGKTVAFAGQDAVLHIREVAGGKDVHTIRVAEERYRVEGGAGTKGVTFGGIMALAYSPDGRLLASAGYDATVRLWDTATGTEVRKLRGHGREVCGVAFAPDGKSLVSCGRDHTIRVWDVAGGKERQPRAGHAGPVHGLSVSRDGKRLASIGHDHMVRLWDAQSGAPLHALAGSGDFIYTVDLSPSGAVVAAGELRAAQLWDASTGKALRRIAAPSLGYVAAVFSPDGKYLACAWHRSKGEGGELSLWDPASGEERRRIAADAASGFCEPQFSADGKKLAAYARGAHIWDSATGKHLRHIEKSYHHAFLPDGDRLLALSGSENPTVSVWSIATGKELQRFAPPDKINATIRFALSPDGRTVAWSLKDHTIALWELATGKRRRCLAGHRGAVESLAFAPDGRRLYSGSEDTTILAWDLAREKEARRSQGTAMDLSALWRDLAGQDAERADLAIRLLAAVPERSVPFLEMRLHPAAAVASERLARLVEQLDSDDFTERDRATRNLEELGEQAEAALRAMLATKPDLETRRRGERLLEKLHGPLPAGERLRSLRALEALEYAGTAQARQLLAVLAAGAPAARLTREARASLERLGRRQETIP